MDVYQCPECELRFRFSSEMQEHMSSDHPDFHVTSKTVEDALIDASHKHRHKSSYRPSPDKNG
ncbi:MAG: hypothetical protein QOG54_1294 [Actinomycetota bacterium]|nr:hypothetical protein [Actinomycetota bacterium]